MVTEAGRRLLCQPIVFQPPVWLELSDGHCTASWHVTTCTYIAFIFSLWLSHLPCGKRSLYIPSDSCTTLQLCIITPPLSLSQSQRRRSLSEVGRLLSSPGACRKKRELWLNLIIPLFPRSLFILQSVARKLPALSAAHPANSWRDVGNYWPRIMRIYFSVVANLSSLAAGPYTYSMHHANLTTWCLGVSPVLWNPRRRYY